MEQYEIRLKVLSDISRRAVMNYVGTGSGIRLVGGRDHLVVETSPLAAEIMEDKLSRHATVRRYRG